MEGGEHAKNQKVKKISANLTHGADRISIGTIPKLGFYYN
jgi:hypothetical protein